MVSLKNHPHLNETGMIGNKVSKLILPRLEELFSEAEA
jgi:hypothetical protein